MYEKTANEEFAIAVNIPSLANCDGAVKEVMEKYWRDKGTGSWHFITSHGVRCYSENLEDKEYSPIKYFVQVCFFLSPNVDLVWFDLVVYQVSTFYYVWNWSKRLCAGAVHFGPISKFPRSFYWKSSQS